MSAFPHRAHEPAQWTGRTEPNEPVRWAVDPPPGAAHSLAAYVSLWNVHARQYRMDLVVDPAFRRRRLGRELVDFLIAEARGLGATSLQARTYAERTEALRLLESRGFRETMRMTGLELDDVRAVTVEDGETLRRTLEARGLRLTTFAAELRTDAASWEKLRDANQAAQFGWPDPDPNPDGTPQAPESVEEFRSRAEAFGMIPEACFIAEAGGEFVDYSALTIHDAARTQAGSGGTAVRPEHRGLGIATVLKACCIRWAQAHDVRRLATSSGNPAMIRVNETFGFRRSDEEVRTVVRLTGTVSP